MEFGELVEPETRAFWSNYDETENENSEPVILSWKWMDEESTDKNDVKSFENLYIFEGRQIFDFINQTILKNVTPICQLENYKTAVYRLPGNNDVVCLSEGSDIDRTAQITELILPWITAANQVIAFSFQPVYSYNTTKEFDKSCFVRSLHAIDSETDSVDLELSFVEPMEDCNMIYGISAGVSTLRYRSKLSFRCYAIYIDCPTIDSVVSKPIIQLFKKCNLPTSDTYVFKYVNNSNLYI